MKKDFKVYNRVVINRTADARLDGKVGTILGKSLIDHTDTYIVCLDMQLDSTYPVPNAKAIAITESCLDAVH